MCEKDGLSHSVGCALTHLLVRKLDSFRKDSIGSASTQVWFWFHQITKPIMRPYEKSAERSLSRAGYLGFLSQRPSDALPPAFADLLFLYEAVRRRKPRYVLEFGSGCSTAILAQALYDNCRRFSAPKGHLWSVDADAYWAQVTERSMPRYLGEFCDISHSPVSVVNCHGTRAFRHAKVPEIAPDLLYLDGPMLTREVQVSVDVLDIEDRFPAGFYGIIDGRWANTLFLKRHLKRSYQFKHRWLFGNSTFELFR